ncbi:MAG TPA: class I SAM-dependent methyltransferase [Propionibacteriaceae bacterium]|nr:class I SAM-dependent methyltransferase [Propionibacteriaceae bacterium]
MVKGFALAYRLGITPWERAGRGGADQLARLFEREEREHPGTRRALDLGCGRGTHAVTLAQRGWEVTGVDAVPLALDGARARARQANQTIRFLEGDVTHLPPEVGSGYTLVLDIGCFHGLSDEQRVRMGGQMMAAAAPDASVLVLCFATGGRGPMPRGATGADLMRAMPGWTVVDEEPAETSGLPGPLRRLTPTYYRLRRAG